MFRTSRDVPVWGKPHATQTTFQAKNWLLPRKFSGASGAILSSANFEFRGIFYRNRNSKSKSEKTEIRTSKFEISIHPCCIGEPRASRRIHASGPSWPSSRTRKDQLIRDYWHYALTGLSDKYVSKTTPTPGLTEMRDQI